MNNPRIVIIGLDGVPYRLLKDLSERNIMPNTQKIIEQGIFKEMESTIPEISPVAWSSIITGKEPAEHGILGFTDFSFGTYNLSFSNFNNLRAQPFWQKYNYEKSVIINVPSTYPVKPINGVHISGFISLDLKKSVYPPSLIPKLEQMDYRIDVDSDKAHKSIELFLTELDNTLKARIATHRYLWNKIDFSIYMLVFTDTDRLMHFLWDAYEDKNHKYNSIFLEYFHQIDEVIGEIIEEIKEDDLFIMLSDHGFELLEYDVNINYFLKKTKFLKTKEDDFISIDYDTKAFALDPSRIYINTEGKYPRGSIKNSDKKYILEDLKSAFEELEINSKKVIKKVYKKEEIFEGTFFEQSPDLVLLSNSGFNLKANIKAKELFEKTYPFSGKHTHHDAFLLIKGHKNEDIIPDRLSVSNIVMVMEKLRKKVNRE